MATKSVRELASEYLENAISMSVELAYFTGASDVLKMHPFVRIPEPLDFKGSCSWEGTSASVDWTGVPVNVQLLVECKDKSLVVLVLKNKLKSTSCKGLFSVFIDGEGENRKVEFWLGAIKSWRVLNPPLR